MRAEEAAELALEQTLLDVPALRESGMTKAELAEAVQVFLRGLEDRLGWPAVIAVRTVHGIISKLRRKHGWQ